MTETNSRDVVGVAHASIVDDGAHYAVIGFVAVGWTDGREYDGYGAGVVGCAKDEMTCDCGRTTQRVEVAGLRCR